MHSDNVLAAAFQAIIVGATMIACSIYAALAGETAAAGAFGLWGSVILFGGIGASIGFKGMRSGAGSLREDVLTLLFLWLLLPFFAAVPVNALTPDLGFVGAYFEMVSGFTTSGATLLGDLELRDRTLLLWRSATQWLGGLGALAAVLAVLAPRRLGTFDLRASAVAGDLASAQNGAASRWRRATLQVGPLYAALTLLLFLGYYWCGAPAFDALNHAMTTISTGGFSTRSEGLAAFSNLGVEAVAALGMLLGATGIGLYDRIGRRRLRQAARDSESRLLVLILVVAILVPFARHSFAAFELGSIGRLDAAFRTLWSEAFLAISFLTTTGFGTSFAGAPAMWSGLDSAATLFLGLAAIGGAAASTAGGVRLRNVALMIRHGAVEIGHIGQPRTMRSDEVGIERRRQVRLAWVGAMLFALGAAGGMLIVSALDMQFQDSMSIVIASLSNVGPLFPVAVGDAHAWFRIPDEVLLSSAILMVMGRVGVVSVVALLLFR